MIQVIQRAFDVLEYLARTADRACGLREIADATGLNPATCARILATLMSEGYVDQEGRRQGYRLGPMPYALTAHGPYRKDLMLCAEASVRELAETTRETSLVAILHRHTRFIICRVEGTQDIQVRSDSVLRGDVYPTPTGRLLLAHLTREDLEEFIRHTGLPKATAWPDVRTKQSLLAALASLRDEDTVTVLNAGQLVGLAQPIRNADRVVAALGLYLPASRFAGVHKQTILKAMRAAANTISERLTAMHAPLQTAQ